jgi:hypothetical protein
MCAVERVNVLSVKGPATADSASIARGRVNARNVREAAAEKPGTNDTSRRRDTITSRRRDNIKVCSIN